MKDFVSAFKAADLLGVSGTTVLRWVHEGRFPNVLIYSGTERDTIRIPFSDIESLKQQKEGA